MPKAPRSEPTASRHQPLTKPPSKSNSDRTPAKPTAPRPASKKPLNDEATDIDGILDSAPSSTSPSALGSGKTIDKALALKLIIAKLEASKNCDWYALSVRMNQAGVRRDDGSGSGGGKSAVRGRGKGSGGGRGKGRGGGKAGGRKGKGDAEDEDDEYVEEGTAEEGSAGKSKRKGDVAEEWTGAELYDLYHSIILPALKAGRPLWTDDTTPADFSAFYDPQAARPPLLNAAALARSKMSPSLPPSNVVSRTATAMTGITTAATEVDNDVDVDMDDMTNVVSADTENDTREGGFANEHMEGSVIHGESEDGDDVVRDRDEEVEGDELDLDDMFGDSLEPASAQDSLSDTDRIGDSGKRVEEPSKELARAPSSTASRSAQRKLNFPVKYKASVTKRGAAPPALASVDNTGLKRKRQVNSPSYLSGED